ncbi:diaminopimelate decarboxylase [Sandaracinus amylolyticus]|uniref:Diaminopimelate decarboxylase n=1 Tax=Sandaracinus amylolyticus TaxID=927083 RepID=A0A0F6W3F8_9BACT|nr:diaminopimelate decarboxylase [Sandaracinus amylolyticus]AKF06308.1 Diaminopimelate decarboxylase [Sandaracinus amylolyticus]
MGAKGTRADVPPSAHFVHDEDEGELAIDGMGLSTIAEEVGTPAHVYSASAIERAYRAIDASLAPAKHMVCYAMKANGHPEILRLLASLGAGADVVSGGELYWALAAGIPPERIVFSGVGKSDAEIAYALDAGIRAIHVESEPEIDVIEAIAREKGVTARIALRVNPDVDPVTHPYIATGIHGTKFGLELDVARRLLPRIVESDGLELEGIACHIGSQIGGAKPLEDAVAIVAAFAKECAEAGAPIRALDAGGGWPIHYGDEDAPYAPWNAFGAAIRAGIERGGASDLDLEIVVEPGRAMVGDAGGILTRVLYVKEQGTKRFVIVDAAMTELLRPSLYGAYHAIVPVRAREGDVTAADIVGPVCETGDFLALDRPLPPVQRGDLLLIRSTGAYGAAMATRYNARPLAAEVIVEGDAYRVIRERERVEDLYPRGA